MPILLRLWNIGKIVKETSKVGNNIGGKEARRFPDSINVGDLN